MIDLGVFLGYAKDAIGRVVSERRRALPSCGSECGISRKEMGGGGGGGRMSRA